MKNKLFTPDEQAVLQQIMQLRRDVRGNRFTDQPIHDEELEKILLAATSAPSVGFSQPWEFVIVRDDEVKSQVARVFASENDKAKKQFSEKQSKYAELKLEGINEAPINIAVFYKPSNEPVLGQTSIPEMGEYSVVCAVQNMWLMARALNIGLGWVSILKPDSVKKIVKAPAENKLVAYLCLGYVDEFLKKPELETLKWQDKKSLSSVIQYDYYSPK